MSQRLTDSDASFLYMESASGPMHISSIYVLEGELPYAQVYQHFADRIHLLPTYRRRLAQVPFNLAHPTWEDDPEFDLANHVVQHALPEGTSLQEGIDAAVELNEPMLDRSKPLWRFVVISGVPDKTLILQQTHHAMIDGVSGIEITTILYDFDAKGGNRPPPPNEPWDPAPVPSPMERIGQALRDNLEKARPSRALDLLSNAEGQRALMGRAARVLTQFISRPVITAPFNAGLVGPRRRALFLKKSFGDIREIRRALGGTINDVVLTVVSEAVARYLAAHDENTESQYMRIMCPVSVRTEDQAGALGNQVSAIFPVLPAWPMNVRQRLNAVCTETDRIKADQEAQALALMTTAESPIWPVALAPTQLVGTPFDPTVLAARMPMPVMNTGWRPPNIGINFVCTNVPGVQVPQYLCGHRVTDTVGLLVLTGNVGFSVTILSYNKELYFNFICEPRLLPDLEMIAEAADEAFTELQAEARERVEQMAS
ncbi:MAG: wax ester/triacylglycerol synthase family O-acyltransferase [Pseudomonadales bacterium]